MVKKKVMEKESKGKKEPVQIFINSTYFGDLQTLIDKKSSIKEYFSTEMNNQPGDLYQIYKGQNDLIEITPPICYLPPPFPKSITSIIKFTNKFDGVVAFKIKSKYAKKYGVKPKEGLIGPLETKNIEFSISKDEEIPLKEDKFKIETIRVSDVKDEKNAVNEAFKNNEKNIVSHIIECDIEGVTHSNIKITQFNDGRVQVEGIEERKSLTLLESPVVFPKEEEKVEIKDFKEEKEKLEKLEKEKLEKDRLQKIENQKKRK